MHRAFASIFLKAAHVGFPPRIEDDAAHLTKEAADTRPLSVPRFFFA